MKVKIEIDTKTFIRFWLVVIGFVLAGWLNQRWLARGWSPRRRRLAYAVVLWLGAALLWVLVAATSDIRFS